MVVANRKKSSTALRALSFFSIVLAIVYVLMPIDFDGPIVGFIDDFFIFMASFCFCISQFTKDSRASKMLVKISLFFVIATLILITLLAFTPIVSWTI